jgi:hypothetical protein
MQGIAINRAMTMSWERSVGLHLHIRGLALLYSSFKGFNFFFKLLALRTLNKCKYSIIGYVRRET